MCYTKNSYDNFFADRGKHFFQMWKRTYPLTSLKGLWINQPNMMFSCLKQEINGLYKLGCDLSILIFEALAH